MNSCSMSLQRTCGWKFFFTMITSKMLCFLMQIVPKHLLFLWEQHKINKTRSLRQDSPHHKWFHMAYRMLVIRKLGLRMSSDCTYHLNASNSTLSLICNWMSLRLILPKTTIENTVILDLLFDNLINLISVVIIVSKTILI